jgi:hypothetical protein
MTSSNAVDAPWNDLNLFHSLLKYKSVNSVVSDSAVKAFKSHLWYLTEEMVPIALWSNKVPESARRALADKLLAVKPETPVRVPKHRFGTGFGKPKLPSTVSLSSGLADFVSTDSWYIFNVLQLNSDFMTEDVVNWPQSASFQSSLINLQALNVVNDCAERGVKLSSDFIASAKGEHHYQNILQAAERNRKLQPDLRKRRRTVDSD